MYDDFFFPYEKAKPPRVRTGKKVAVIGSGPLSAPIFLK